MSENPDLQLNESHSHNNQAYYGQSFDFRPIDHAKIMISMKIENTVVPHITNVIRSTIVVVRICRNANQFSPLKLIGVLINPLIHSSNPQKNHLQDYF